MAPTISCPSCNYDLSQTQAPRCPECGAPFDRELQLLLQPRPREMSRAHLAFLLFCAIGWIPAAMTAAWARGALDWELALAVLFPYSALLSQMGPFGFPLGMGLAVMQWPFYGVILCIHWPPRKYASIWLGLWGAHTAASLAAWLCSR